MKVSYAFLLNLLFNIALLSQGTIEGVVVDKLTGEPLPSANILLVEPKRGTITDINGIFIFKNIPPGNYTLEVSYVGYKKFRERINVKGEDVTKIKVEIEQMTIHLPGVIVSASPFERSAFEIHQPVNILDEEKLGIRLGDNIAKTLEYEPGINMEYNGSSAGRPVIRGLTGTRVLILDNGVRIGDASELAPDHAIMFDPISVERIEIIRGPASLFYGTNSIGGAVNIITHDIPKNVRDKLIGAFRLSGATVNSSLAGAGFIEYGISKIGLRAELNYRNSGDTRTPAGRLDNTSSSNISSAIGIAYHSEDLSSGFAIRTVSGNYGVPTQDEKIRFEVRRTKYEFKTEYKSKSKKVSGLQLHINRTNYIHREIEDKEIGTQIELETSNLDFKLKHEGIWKLNGMLGINLLHQNYRTKGEEKFFADARTFLSALIIYEEMHIDNFILQAGGRLDIVRIKSAGFAGNPPAERSFHVLSGSAGVIYQFISSGSIAFNFSRGYRIPTLQELFAYGPHLGTQSFEVGNLKLGSELANEIDISIRLSSRKMVGEISVFYNLIKNYIYPEATGKIDPSSKLPVYRYSSTDALLRGYEIKFQLGLTENLNFVFISDYVEGRDIKNSSYLPFIPPLRGIIGLEYRTSKFNIGGEVKLVSNQEKLAPGEERTPGYGIINIYLGLRFPYSGMAHEISLKVENLMDKLYKDHLSRIKDIAPMPGRSVNFVYHLYF